MAQANWEPDRRTGHSWQYGASALRTGQADRPQLTIWRKRTACWIPMAACTKSQHVMLLAFPLQWLHNSSSMLRYTYVACTVRLRFCQQWRKFPSFLGYCTALTGKMFLMFRRTIVPLSSGLSVFLDCLTLSKTALGSWQESITIHQSSKRNIPAGLLFSVHLLYSSSKFYVNTSRAGSLE